RRQKRRVTIAISGPDQRVGDPRELIAPLLIFASPVTVKMQRSRFTTTPCRLQSTIRPNHLHFLRIELDVVSGIKLDAASQPRQRQIEDELITPRYVRALIHPHSRLRPATNECVNL